MQITTMRYHFISIKLEKNLNSDNAKCTLLEGKYIYLKKKPLENIIATFNKAEDRHSLLPINFNSKYIQKCHTCTQENVYKDVHCNIVHNS